jgi:pyridoxine kinase
MKKVVTMQDISCVGKCSLTVALPVISAMGIETAVIPTAVLSTHTMFQGFTFHDLTGEILPIIEHWKKEGFRFDAVYTGYLGTVEQIEMMKKLFDTFGKDGIVFVDPVMADNGKLYPAFDMEYAKKNTELCSHADIIVPNITEAAFMTGMEYREEYDEAYVKEMLSRLDELGAKISILTGVSLEEGKTGVMGYERATGEYYLYQNKKIDAAYHGTGDLFSSIVIGEIMKGLDWRDALRIAADHTAHTIEVTLKNPAEPWYGVDFEATMPELISAK